MTQSREIPDATGLPVGRDLPEPSEAQAARPAAAPRGIGRRRVPVWSLVLRTGLGLALIGLGLWFLQREPAPAASPADPAPEATRPD